MIQDSTDESIRNSFEWSVRALAQPAEIQRTLYPPFVEVEDELASEFEERLAQYLGGAISASLTAKERDLIASLDSHLELISADDRAELWTEQGLQTAPEWDTVRNLAKEVLSSLNCPLDPPPFERGYVYVPNSGSENTSDKPD